MIQSPISERLKFLQNVFGLSEADLAKMIGVSQTSLNRAIRGDTKPSFDSLVSIVETLGVEPRFLLMGSGPAFANESLSENEREICRRLAKAIEGKGLNSDQVSILSGIGAKTIENMVNCRAVPSLQDASALAKVLQVSLDFLATGAEPSPPQNDLARRITALEARLARAGL